MLGRAIQTLKLPREELVIMTKVRCCPSLIRPAFVESDITRRTLPRLQLQMALAKAHDTNVLASGLVPDEIGLVNQYGLSRKVRRGRQWCIHFSMTAHSSTLWRVSRLAWSVFNWNTLTSFNVRTSIPPFSEC